MNRNLGNITTLAIAQHENGELLPATWEALAAAERLCPDPNQLACVVLGGNTEALAREIAGDTGRKVIAINGRGLEHYTGPGYLTAFKQVFGRNPPRHTCLSHTSQGMDLAPALAVAWDAECAANVVHIKTTPEGPLLSSPLANAAFYQDVSVGGERLVFTVQPGVFSLEKTDGPPGRVILWEKDLGENPVAYLGSEDSLAQDSGLDQAGVIVAAGRGVGEDHMDIIHETASLFPRSVVAGSRAACDLGWVPVSRQVGVTGKTVAPAFYLACGISGAFQHVAGMKGAQFVVSVNTDPRAPIHRVSHICIQEDLSVFLPAFIQTFRKNRG